MADLDLEATLEIQEDQAQVVWVETLDQQATVDLVVETVWEDLVLEILTLMPEEEKK